MLIAQYHAPHSRHPPIESSDRRPLNASLAIDALKWHLGQLMGIANTAVNNVPPKGFWLCLIACTTHFFYQICPNDPSPPHQKSNGPGDPQKVFNNIKSELKKIIESKIPTFGICLGHQILSLAFNAKTKRMDKGHRGGNHPVKNLETGRVEITSQNHGFVVSKDDFPIDLEISHISLFDHTVDGMKSKSQPLFSVQYHPESSPGPHDSRYLFDKFIELMKSDAS